MDAMHTSFGEVLLWSFWFFIWISALMIWFRCLWDLFGDSTVSGWGKAGWAILLVFVPWLGALIYLIARGRSMGERQMAAMAAQRADQEKYIK
ncbi:MAG TPA: PLDc N-terminal domain-containing protein, partial [Lapillicoccus sp.]|uniref:PLDc N-terminal domain-containing protein n=1 Tax=Lapillicoccus sp. TaxID=1909287 RepID=UPI002F92CE09